MTRRVVVTGLGVISPVGNSVQEFWGSLFGWKFEAFPGPSEYHMTRIGETTGGAITNMEPGKRGPGRCGFTSSPGGFARRSSDRLCRQERGRQKSLVGPLA